MPITYLHLSAQAHICDADVKLHCSGRSHNAVAAEAHIGGADLKLLCGGRSQKLNKIFEKFGM